MTLKLLHLWRQSQKICTLSQKIFFQVQYTRLADPFKPLNSSLVQSAEELGRGKATENCCFLAEIEVRIYRRSALKVLRKMLGTWYGPVGPQFL